MLIIPTFVLFLRNRNYMHKAFDSKQMVAITGEEKELGIRKKREQEI